MKFLQTKRKYLVLIPVVFLLFNALYFRAASREIRGAMLQEKIIQVTEAIDMLGAAVEANPDRLWYDHEKNIIDSVEYLDQIYQVFAAAYKPVDGKLTPVTARYCEGDPIEPLDNPDFYVAVQNHNNGSITQDFMYDDEPLELHMYYLWMPLYAPPDERYLLAIGVSQSSIVTAIPFWVSAGQWVNTGIMLLLIVIVTVMLSRLGYIWESRKGPNKWRGVNFENSGSEKNDGNAGGSEAKESREGAENTEDGDVIC